MTSCRWGQAQPDIDSLDFGAPRELQHAEALVLVTLLGPVTAARLAAKLCLAPDSGETRDMRTLLQKIMKNSTKIGSQSKVLGAATLELYLSSSILSLPLPSAATLTALKRKGMSRIELAVALALLVR